jgi:hypothetical protein
MTTTTTKRVGSGAAGGATLRVVGAITTSTTVRVPEEVIGLGPFLLLEGDFAGALALEGDEDGYLKLEGTY